MLNNDLSLIGLSETWQQDYTWDLYHLDDCTFLNSQNDGGVCLFINEEIQSDKCADLFMDDCMECVTIDVEHKSLTWINIDKNMIVSVIYRTPFTETDVFIDTMNAFIENITPENKYCHLMGDYNTDILNSATHSATVHFVDPLYYYWFFLRSTGLPW